MHAGHSVAPIEWSESNQCWDIGQTVIATTVKVYDNVFPLRMGPDKGGYKEQDFDKFVDHTFEPLLMLQGSSSDGVETEASQQTEQA